MTPNKWILLFGGIVICILSGIWCTTSIFPCIYEGNNKWCSAINGRILIYDRPPHVTKREVGWYRINNDVTGPWWECITDPWPSIKISPWFSLDIHLISIIWPIVTAMIIYMLINHVTKQKPKKSGN